jgi:hypothetical protein
MMMYKPRLPERDGGGGAEWVFRVTFQLQHIWTWSPPQRFHLHFEENSFKIRYFKFEPNLLKMATPPNRELSAVRAPAPQTDIDICFIDKEGKVSVGNSWQYGKSTPALLAQPIVSSRSPNSAAVGISPNPATTSVAGPSSGTSSQGSQHQTEATSSDPETNQNKAPTSPLPEQTMLKNSLLSLFSFCWRARA